MRADSPPGAAGLERLLLAIGVICLVWWVVATVEATRYQSEQRRVLKQMRAAPLGSAPATAAVSSGSLIGLLDIPRLRLSAVVAEGDDDATLKVAIGHLPDTPLPWQGGNTALAAHRDTLFRPLEDIRVGDDLRLWTRHGEFVYRVRATTVVDPADVSVLDPTDRPTLTLITCYPFAYIGSAPRRFIVRAELTLEERRSNERGTNTQ